MSENEAFQRVLEKEYLGYACCIGLGVTSSQFNRSMRSASSFENNKRIKEMQEIIAYKEKN